MKRIIIGGLPRSGSTLLRFILDASGKIISGPETAFFTRPLSDTLLRINKLAPKIADKLDMGVKDVTYCVENSHSTLQAFDCLMTSYMKIAEKKANAWAEKTPRNCFHYNRILSESENNNDIFFISTIRNGLDCITSEFEKSDKRYKERRYWVPIQQYIDCMGAIYSFKHQEKHFVLKYEELCNAPEQTIQILSDFLNVELTKDCLSEFNKESVTRNLSKVHQPKLIHSIQDTWINRWRRSEHAQVVDQFLSNEKAMYFFNKSGYKTE
jgi:hypothetical protein